MIRYKNSIVFTVPYVVLFCFLFSLFPVQTGATLEAGKNTSATSENNTHSLSPPTSNTTDKVRVVASFYPILEFVKKVGGDRVEVTSLIPVGIEPHDYDPTIQQIQNAQLADMVVFNGAGLEGERLLDYIVSIDDEKKSVIANSDNLYNGGIRLMAGDTMVFNFFAQCHFPSCIQPNEIRSVYLVSNLIDDNDIVYENIEEDDKVMFERIDGEINKFRLPTIDALFDHEDLYKMVVHTSQTDEIDGYYIVEDVEII